jgi:hypothetical protein
LNKKFYQSSDSLTRIKNSFIKIRDTINGLDNSLTWVLILDITETMLAVMINIYAIAMYSNNEIMKQHSNTYAFKSITSVLKLIISCYINGLVHEESERIYSVLDNFNTRDLDKVQYKEWLMFKNILKDTRIGFTIGGFAALRKTTLIPVRIDRILFRNLIN